MSTHPTPLAWTSNRFTFGVEFEFGIRFKERPFERLTDIWALIRDTLIVETELEVLTELDIDILEDSYKNAPKAPDSTIPSETYTTWVIGEDITLNFSDEQRNDEDHDYYCPLEIQSPILKFGPDALKEIHKMLTALNQKFDIFINSLCGLHVHVGEGNDGFNLEPLQHLMATIWIFEPKISSLLHRSRRAGAMYCAPLQERSNLGVRKYEGNLLDVLLSLTLLSSPDSNELVNMFCGHGGVYTIAYSVLNLRRPFWHPVKRTIEFRQHEGSTDPETVLNWVSFLVELVTWAHKICRQDLKIFLSKYINEKEEYSVEDLFKEIGFPESTIQFYRRKVARLAEAEEEEAEEEEARNAAGNANKGAGQRNDSSSSDTWV